MCSFILIFASIYVSSADPHLFSCWCVCQTSLKMFFVTPHFTPFINHPSSAHTLHCLGNGFINMVSTKLAFLGNCLHPISTTAQIYFDSNRILITYKREVSYLFHSSFEIFQPQWRRGNEHANVNLTFNIIRAVDYRNLDLIFITKIVNIQSKTREQFQFWW